MFDARPALVIVGIVLMVLAAAMLIPAGIDGLAGNHEAGSFLTSAMLSAIVGALLLVSYRGRRTLRLSTRQLFLATVAGWLAAALVAALPFTHSAVNLSVADAIFEATSGVTATGATGLRDLAHLPAGLLMWRALTQWLGGIGVLLTGIVVLPQLDIGGMGQFRIEGSGSAGSGGAGEEAVPRIARLMAALLGFYAGFTVLIFGLLWGAGMAPYPALLHAMSTISCGGFSTEDASLSAWTQPNVQWVVLFGMLLGGAPYQIYPQLAQGRFRRVFANRQLRWYLFLFVMASVALCLWFWLRYDARPLPALRHSAFAVASTMTGTGYASWDWASWRGFPVVVLFMLTFVGGCAGSLSGGLKIFRLRVLIRQMRAQMVRLLRPHAVLRAAPGELGEAVLGFLFIYVLGFAAVSLLLGLLGLPFFSAISAAISALANLGPGLAPSVGPMAGYAAQPAVVKLVLAAAMLLGRVELFAAIVLFMPSYWRP